jgi:hypothetical protein
VRRAQRGGRLRLALEAFEDVDDRAAADRAAEGVGADQLDRRLSPQQAMARPPDVAHAAVAEPLDELVATELKAGLHGGSSYNVSAR